MPDKNINVNKQILNCDAMTDLTARKACLDKNAKNSFIDEIGEGTNSDQSNTIGKGQDGWKMVNISGTVALATMALMTKKDCSGEIPTSMKLMIAGSVLHMGGEIASWISFTSGSKKSQATM